MMEAIRQDTIDKIMADKNLPAEIKRIICSMPLDQMLAFLQLERDRLKGKDANAHIAFLPAITRTPSVKIAKGSMAAYETISPSIIHYVQDSGLGDFYFNLYIIRHGEEKFKIACCLGDSIDGVYGRNIRNKRVLEELPPSKKRISPTLYDHINNMDETMFHETGYVNTVNFCQGYKEWFAMVEIEDKGARQWADLCQHGPMQMDMTLGMRMALVMVLAGDIIKEITESGNIPAITKLNNYLGWDLRKEHYWK